MLWLLLEAGVMDGAGRGTRGAGAHWMPEQSVHVKTLKLSTTYWLPLEVQSAHCLLSGRFWISLSSLTIFSSLDF